MLTTTNRYLNQSAVLAAQEAYSLAQSRLATARRVYPAGHPQIMRALDAQIDTALALSDAIDRAIAAGC